MTAPVGPPNFEEPVFGQRLLARVVDVLLMLPVVALATFAVDGRGGTVVALGAVAAYEIGMVARDGRTVGKVLFGTRIVDARTGRAPIPLQAVLRCGTVVGGAVLVVAVPALGGLEVLWAVVVLAPVLRGPLHQGVHDRVATTIVIADVVDEEIAI